MSEQDREQSVDASTEAATEDAIARRANDAEGEDDFEGHRHSPGADVDSAVDAVVEGHTD